jgi:hypothetical protein
VTTRRRFLMLLGVAPTAALRSGQTAESAPRDAHEVRLIQESPNSEYPGQGWLAECTCLQFQRGDWLKVLPGAVGHLHEVHGQTRDGIVVPGPLVLSARLPATEDGDGLA